MTQEPGEMFDSVWLCFAKVIILIINLGLYCFIFIDIRTQIPAKSVPIMMSFVLFRWQSEFLTVIMYITCNSYRPTRLRPTFEELHLDSRRAPHTIRYAVLLINVKRWQLGSHRRPNYFPSPNDGSHHWRNLAMLAGIPCIFFRTDWFLRRRVDSIGIYLATLVYIPA